MRNLFIIFIAAFNLCNAQDKIVNRYLQEFGSELENNVVEVDDFIIQSNKYNKTIIELYDIIYVVKGDIIAPQGMSVTLHFENSKILYLGNSVFNHKNVQRSRSKIQLMSKKEFRKYKDDDYFFIYKNGKVLTKGTVRQLKMNEFPIGMYDIKVKGKKYYSNYILL